MPEETKEEEKAGGDDAMSKLDLFSQEEMDEDENLLVKSLPEVDVHELLEDCKALLAELNERQE